MSVRHNAKWWEDNRARALARSPADMVVRFMRPSVISSNSLISGSSSTISTLGVMCGVRLAQGQLCGIRLLIRLCCDPDGQKLYGNSFYYHESGERKFVPD